MIFSVSYFILFFCLYLALLLLFLFNRPSYSLRSATPPVSILIAVRNEESTIRECLAAIEMLEYPPDKIEVLIGDDQSSDRTWDVISSYRPAGFSYRCVRITETLGQARGKGNVLAHLAHLATSDFLFITDADIKVPPSWITSMLSQLRGKVGIVTGITTITGSRLFYRLQAIDWLYSLGLMQAVTEAGLPVSTMGNNMLISRPAYTSVGGFEGIPFSVTEDVMLFREILKQGWGFRNVFHRNVLAVSAPAPDVAALLHQRKRWMKGSMNLPWYMVAILTLHSAYYPIVLPFFLHAGVAVTLLIFFSKLALQTIYIKLCLRRLQLPASLPLLLFFEVYQLVLSLVLIAFFFLPVRISWKGRRY
jgi:cellulose synthase/poly-beta-1,6-N-acetylglucosamine synthase-like glycosyltransferase